MNDELRIMYEMKTFTSDDIANALEMTRSGANYLLERAVKARYVHRIRVGKWHLYALTERGIALVERLPVIDENEMCLPLSWDGINDGGPECRSIDIVYDAWNEEPGYDALYKHWFELCSKNGWYLGGGVIDSQD